MSNSNHKLRVVSSGDAINDTQTPHCFCGWSGRSVGNHNDYQHSLVRNEYQAHVASVMRDSFNKVV